MRNLKKRGGALILLVVLLLLTSCSLNKPITEVQPELDSTLNVYGWKDYFPHDALVAFNKEYNVSVNVYTFVDENEMISQVQSAPGKYDVIVAGDVIISDMQKLKLLSKLNKEYLPNIKNINSLYSNQWYDTDNTYSVPYLLGTTGLIINTKYVQNTNSWGVLWNRTYRGKLAVLNDPDELLAMALKYAGYSLNSESPDERATARVLLIKQEPILVTFNSGVDRDKALLEEKIWAAQIHSREIRALSVKNNDLEYVVPNEGVPLWIDNLAITRDSQKKYTAHIFLNFMMDGAISAGISNNLWLANPNNAAQKYSHRALLNDPTIYLSDDIVKKSEYFKQKPYTSRFG